MRLRLLLAISVILSISACESISERKQPRPTLEQLASLDLKLDGEQLASAYCAACHLKPNPSLLDKRIWETRVLPDMRKRMGLYMAEDIGSPLPEDLGIPKGIYADFPLIKEKDWAKLAAYYLENAPDVLAGQEEKSVPTLGIPGFELVQPSYPQLYADLTTMLRIHPETGHLWVGQRYQKLFVVDPKNNFQVSKEYNTEVAPIDIHWNSDNSFDLLTMGLMDPSPDSVGVLANYTDDRAEAILNQLIRPVDITYADWNNDGQEDRVISHFGDHIGKLSLYLTTDSGLQEEVLSTLAGARRTIAVDFDEDGLLDVLGLMTQAQEGVFLWRNQGDGTFKERELIRFHPVFGASDFRFVDMDGDGMKDLILVNGDNADLSPILKNYHGLRIYKNLGEGQFEEKWFYPMYGASGLEVGDFDGDGAMDIFAISFFPDPEQQPKQNLIYFQQKGLYDFEPFVLAEKLTQNWMTLTSGDLDLDGDLDLVIGSFEFEELYTKPENTWTPFIVLKNLSK